MSRLFRTVLSRVVPWGLAIGVHWLAPNASADSWLRTKNGSKDKPSTSRSTARSAESRLAPYSVRVRIASFLARQHTREGDRAAALDQLHTLLVLEDPSWERGAASDALRVARDIDVARLMAELGFFDYAVRVLETALVQAQVHDDPQVVVLQKQLKSTLELASQKGVAIPSFDALRSDPRATSHPVVDAPASPATAQESADSMATDTLRSQAATPVEPALRQVSDVTQAGVHETVRSKAAPAKHERALRQAAATPNSRAGSAARDSSETQASAANAPNPNREAVVKQASATEERPIGRLAAARSEMSTSVANGVQRLKQMIPTFSWQESAHDEEHASESPRSLRPWAPSVRAAEYCPECAQQHGNPYASLANPVAADPWKRPARIHVEPPPANVPQQPEAEPAPEPQAPGAVVDSEAPARPANRPLTDAERPRTGGLLGRWRGERRHHATAEQPPAVDEAPPAERSPAEKM